MDERATRRASQADARPGGADPVAAHALWKSGAGLLREALMAGGAGIDAHDATEALQDEIWARYVSGTLAAASSADQVADVVRAALLRARPRELPVPPLAGFLGSELIQVTSADKSG